MIQAQLVGLGRRGFGALGYTEGQDFTCTDSCGSTSTDVDGTFRYLQYALNLVASRAGYSAVVVDGRIGANTLSATNKAIAALSINVPAVQSVNDLASQADWYSQAIYSAASSAGLPLTPATNASLSPGAPTPGTTKKSSLWWWVGGAALIAGAGAGAFWIAKRHRETMPPRRRSGRSGRSGRRMAA